MPKLVKNAVNDFLTQVKIEKSFQAIFYLSLILAGLYMLLSLGKGIFLFLTRQMIIIVSRYIEYDLKNEIYVQYQRLNFSFYKKNKTGDLMNRISEDVTQVRMYLGPGLMYSINLVILSIMAIITMLKINVSLTLIVLAPLPIMSFLIYRVSSKMNKLSKFKQEELSNLSTIVQETFSGIRVIKAYLRELEMKIKFDSSAEEYKKRNMKLVMVNALFMPTIVFLIGLSVLLTIYYGGLLTYSGDITPGDIIAFIFYVNMLTWPFASVGWVTSINQRAAASQTRINEFLSIKPEIVNNSNQPLGEIKSIVFENVSFKYENSDFEAINNLSFTLKKGKSLGIVGRTGSGKSTILNLLTRQLDPSSGKIYINGIDLKEINLDDFRSQLGVVPQDVFLFSDTIGNNIKFGVNQQDVKENDLIEVSKIAHVYHNIVFGIEGKTEAQVIEAAKIANAHDFISEMPNGYHANIGDRGSKLSGGQKQRISIARALIRKPKLLLLDDCLSAVDTETEDAILKGIDNNFKDNISIIVSHRTSSLRLANKIIVIENGQKIEEGTHDELLKNEGIYKEMYQKQLVEEV